MIRKIIEAYLKKKGLYAIPAQELEKVISYRSLRAELRKTKNDFNLVLLDYSYKLNLKELTQFLERAHIKKEDIPKDKDKARSLYFETYKKEF